MSGDRSLLNHGAPTAPRAVGNKKETVGPTVPRLEGGFPRLRPVAAFLVPARGGNPALRAELLPPGKWCEGYNPSARCAGTSLYTREADKVRLRRGSLRAALRQKEMRPRAAKKNPRRTASGVVERAKGVEPSYQAWEACILPMNYARGNESIIPQIFDFSRAFLHDGEKSFRQGAAKRDSGGAGPPLSGRLEFIPFSRIWPRPDGRFAGDWCRRRCGDGSPPDGA